MLTEYTYTIPEQAPAQHEHVQFLPHHLIQESPHNPRRSYDATALEELADSICRQGILQPILVRQLDPPSLTCTHEIVFGHRRWRAAAGAGLTEVPVIVRRMTDEAARLAQHAENLHREDVHYLEEADSLAELIAGGMSADRLAAELGKSRSYVYGRAKLADLGEPARRAALADGLPAEIALMIARLPESIQPQALASVMSADDWLSSRDAKRRLSSFATPLDQAAWALHDAHLLDDDPSGAAPACTTCHRNSINDPSITDIDSPVCLLRPCWVAKQAAHDAKAASAAAETASASAEPAAPSRQPAGSTATPADWAGIPAERTPADPPHHQAAPAPKGIGAAEEWSAEETAAASDRVWTRAMHQIAATLRGSQRTIPDLRTIVLAQSLSLPGFGVAIEAYGMPRDLCTGDMASYIDTLPADTLSSLSVLLAIESICESGGLSLLYGRIEAAARVRIATAYGIDLIAMDAQHRQSGDDSARTELTGA